MSKSTIDAIHTDKSTDALTTIDYEHHELHQGSMFTCHYIQTVSDIADRSVIAFTTPAVKEIHMVVRAASTAASNLIILEGATALLPSAVDLTIYNRDRNSSKASELTSIDATAGKASYYTLTTDTGITGGTELYNEYIGAGKTGQAVGGSSRGANEWILKKSTVYDIELKAIDANDNVQNLELVWYEHTPKRK
jgi:hypothetical protein